MIGVIITIVICVSISFWVFVIVCGETDTWIFNKDYYSNKVAILREIRQLHKEVADLKEQMNDTGFFKKE